MNTTHKYKTHTFTLVLQGVDKITTAFEDAVFEAGCDDAMLYSKNGTIFLEFDRVDKTLKSAIVSAILDIETISGIEVAVVEPADYITVAEIARRSCRTREYIRKLINGERGPGHFPKPLAGISTKTLIYSWVDVSTWLTTHGILNNYTIHRIAFILKRLNDTLDARKHPCRGAVPLQLLKKINISHLQKN